MSNIEDVKTVVDHRENSDEAIFAAWMSRVQFFETEKYRQFLSIANAGIDTNEFLMRVSITSSLGNLLLITNDTALDRVFSLLLLRGDGGGDSEIMFDATPDVTNEILASLEYLNVCGLMFFCPDVEDHEEKKFLVDTVIVRASSANVTSEKTIVIHATKPTTEWLHAPVRETKKTTLLILGGSKIMGISAAFAVLVS